MGNSLSLLTKNCTCDFTVAPSTEPVTTCQSPLLTSARCCRFPSRPEDQHGDRLNLAPTASRGIHQDAREISLLRIVCGASSLWFLLSRCGCSICTYNVRWYCIKEKARALKLLLPAFGRRRSSCSVSFCLLCQCRFRWRVVLCS